MRKSRAKKPFRSKFEASIAAQLRSIGVKYSYESETLKYTSRVRGGRCDACGSTSVHKRRTYTPDFIVVGRKGKLYIEVKGRLTSMDRTKMLDVLRCNPSINLLMVFQRDNKIDSKRKYSDWCKKHSIQFCIKEVEKKYV